jgi:hypothetical protein
MDRRMQTKAGGSSRKSRSAAKSADVKLVGRLGLADVPGLHAMLLERIEPGRPLTIDGSAIEDIELPVLQLLLSAVRSAHDAGCAVSTTGFDNASWRTAAARAGIAPDQLSSVGPASTFGQG